MSVRVRVLLLLSVAAALAASEISAAEKKELKVIVEKGISYLEEGRNEKADLYLPPTAKPGEKRPGIVMIHGGGWTGGKRDAAREINICTTLALEGYVCLSIDYMLQPEKGPRIWPQNLHDCKTAVRWLRANAERLQIDTDHIGVIGGSAGGHLAALVGVTGPESGLDPEGPYGEHSCQVQAVIDLYGPMADDPRRIARLVDMNAEGADKIARQVTPLNHLDAKDPPVLIMHGTADTTVPHSESEKFANALKEAGVTHELVIIPDAPHTFHLQPKQRDLRPVVINFLNTYLKPKAQGDQ